MRQVYCPVYAPLSRLDRGDVFHGQPGSGEGIAGVIEHHIDASQVPALSKPGDRLPAIGLPLRAGIDGPRLLEGRAGSRFP